MQGAGGDESSELAFGIAPSNPWPWIAGAAALALVIFLLVRPPGGTSDPEDGGTAEDPVTPSTRLFFVDLEGLEVEAGGSTLTAANEEVLLEHDPKKVLKLEVDGNPGVLLCDPEDQTVECWTVRKSKVRFERGRVVARGSSGRSVAEGSDLACAGALTCGDDVSRYRLELQGEEPVKGTVAADSITLVVDGTEKGEVGCPPGDVLLRKFRLADLPSGRVRARAGSEVSTFTPSPNSQEAWLCVGAARSRFSVTVDGQAARPLRINDEAIRPCCYRTATHPGRCCQSSDDCQSFGAADGCPVLFRCEC